jgi:hypothetical protein
MSVRSRWCEGEFAPLSILKIDLQMAGVIVVIDKISKFRLLDSYICGARLIEFLLNTTLRCTKVKPELAATIGIAGYAESHNNIDVVRKIRVDRALLSSERAWLAYRAAIVKTLPR